VLAQRTPTHLGDGVGNALTAKSSDSRLHRRGRTGEPQFKDPVAQTLAEIGRAGRPTR
jgi:hypothetical protein